MATLDTKELKACFCDGSCHISGVCGGDRHIETGDLLIKDFTIDTGVRVNHEPEPCKAHQLKRKASEYNKQVSKLVERESEKLYREELLPILERKASVGLLEYCGSFTSLDESLKCALGQVHTALQKLCEKDGFKYTKETGPDFTISWWDESLFPNLMYGD